MKFLFFTLTLLFVSLGFAQDVGTVDWIPVDPIFVPPPWLETLLLYIQSLPTVGPVVVFILKWSAVASVVTTSLAVATIGTLEALSKALSKAGYADAAKTVKAKAGPVIYWLKYLSVLNAKKEAQTLAQKK